MRSWARMRLVLCGRVCSERLIFGAGSDRMEFGSYDFRHSSTIVVCIVEVLRYGFRCGRNGVTVTITLQQEVGFAGYVGNCFGTLK